MKIKVDKKIVDEYLLNKDMNIAAADSLFNFCFYSAEASFNHNDYLSSIVDYLDLNLNNDEDRYFYESRIKKAISLIKQSEYDSDYYRQSIKPKEYKDKNYQLTYLKIKPYQAIPYDDILIDEKYVEVSQIGYFASNFEYLAVLKDDVVWMSTDPNEINTMKASIKEASGHVLAFGLGLGYFPIMCAVKDNVSKVTIIEKDKEIINIFKKHILPLFERKEKIEIIEGDAFEYAKRDLSAYDYLFIDIWHNPEDGLPMFLKFNKILKGTKIKTSYWLEKSILAMYRRCLLTVIEESILGYDDSHYKKAENEYDEIINDLYFKTKDVVVTSKEELNDILKDNQLKNLI